MGSLGSNRLSRCENPSHNAAMKYGLTQVSKQTARWAGVALSAAAVVFAALSYSGTWSYLRGDDLITSVADRFDLSYAPDASKPVRAGDPEWRPLMRVVNTYTRAILRRDKPPVVFARLQAITSGKMEVEGTLIGEWTAPTTPILLLYRKWPAPGTGPIPKEDAILVGTLGDLHEWIRRDQADFDFFWRTLIFGSLSVCVGAFLALPDSRMVAPLRERPENCPDTTSNEFPHTLGDEKDTCPAKGNLLDGKNQPAKTAA
jgi:hypothetical protein